MPRFYSEYELQTLKEQLKVAKERIATLEKALNIVVVPKTCKVCTCSCGNPRDHDEKCVFIMCKKDKCKLYSKPSYCACTSCDRVDCECEGYEDCDMCWCGCHDDDRIRQRIREDKEDEEEREEREEKEEKARLKKEKEEEEEEEEA